MLPGCKDCQRGDSLRGPAPLQGHPVEGSGPWPAYVVLDVVRGTSGEVLMPRDRWSSLGSTSSLWMTVDMPSVWIAASFVHSSIHWHVLNNLLCASPYGKTLLGQLSLQPG